MIIVSQLVAAQIPPDVLYEYSPPFPDSHITMVPSVCEIDGMHELVRKRSSSVGPMPWIDPIRIDKDYCGGGLGPSVPLWEMVHRFGMGTCPAAVSVPTLRIVRHRGNDNGSWCMPSGQPNLSQIGIFRHFLNTASYIVIELLLFPIVVWSLDLDSAVYERGWNVRMAGLGTTDQEKTQA